MRSRSFFCLVYSIFLIAGLHAQDKKVVNTLKIDALNFRNQITRLTEYKDEQKKAKALSATKGEPVKIKIEIDVDSTALEDDSEEPDANDILTGYIKEESDSDAIVAYELHFNRKTKSIIDIIYQLDTPEGRQEKKEEEK